MLKKSLIVINYDIFRRFFLIFYFIHLFFTIMNNKNHDHTHIIDVYKH